MIYVRADESIIGAPVSGTVDDTYLAAWLTDGQPGHPAATTGNMSLTVTPAASLLVDLIAVHHHSLIAAASVSISGSISTTIPLGAMRPTGAFPNAYVQLVTPVSVSSLGLGIVGNGDPIYVSLYAGLSRTLPALRLGRQVTPSRVKRAEGEFSSLAPYIKGVGPIIAYSGSFILSETEMTELIAWHESQREGGMPTLIVPDYPVGVPMLCQFDYTASDFVPGDVPEGSPPPTAEALFEVSMDVYEYPPIVWPV